MINKRVQNVLLEKMVQESKYVDILIPKENTLPNSTFGK